MSDPRPSECLGPTAIVDSDHPLVVDFVAKHARGGTDLERAVSLYYAVRDGYRYDPYKFTVTVEGLRASTVLENGYGWCVPKANLLAAVCRAAGIPARLGYADVRNHLSTAKMRASMKTDVFQWHGYVDIWLEDKWVKATPAFNKSLCDKFGWLPLDFDGRSDSIYHPFDKKGDRHMEYLAYRGVFVECPIDAMAATFGKRDSELAGEDFLKDVDREVAAGAGERAGQARL
ncbi:hypothetical protein DFJ74DRAFT_487880 [Hyaloraphidium curvatum]|nr:hypothetical protein DFJ74DRAFT_487880 [Hyaloraphidium curvatum]